MIEAVGVTILFLILILLGTHLFIALGIAGTLGLYLFRGVGVLSLTVTSFFGQATTYELVALPLFVLMGHVLAKSPIGADWPSPRSQPAPSSAPCRACPWRAWRRSVPWPCRR